MSQSIAILPRVTECHPWRDRNLYIIIIIIMQRAYAHISAQLRKQFEIIFQFFESPSLMTQRAMRASPQPIVATMQRSVATC